MFRLGEIYFAAVLPGICIPFKNFLPPSGKILSISIEGFLELSCIKSHKVSKSMPLIYIALLVLEKGSTKLKYTILYLNRFC